MLLEPAFVDHLTAVRQKPSMKLTISLTGKRSNILTHTFTDVCWLWVYDYFLLHVYLHFCVCVPVTQRLRVCSISSLQLSWDFSGSCPQRSLQVCVCLSACLQDFSTFHNVSNINCYCLDNTQVPSPRIIQPIRSRIGAVLGKEFCYLTVFIKMVKSIMAMDTLKCL